LPAQFLTYSYGGVFFCPQPKEKGEIHVCFGLAPGVLAVFLGLPLLIAGLLLLWGLVYRPD